MNRKIRKYYKYHYWELLDFQYRLYLLGKEGNLNKRVHISANLIHKASNCGLGIYACPELEQPFLDLSRTIITPQERRYESNSFLHVMTQAYTTGGHTRIVERWIETASIEQKHSIVLLNQGQTKFPSSLNFITRKHNGEVIIFEENSLVERAARLRTIALDYEYVILHIHMDDPTSIVAFGTEEFTRPVILFNHADHSFWCGVSIVDMLADLRDSNFANERRGIINKYTIRIPFEPNPAFLNYYKTKKQSRIDLGLPFDKKIILTVGNKDKFQTIGGCDYCSVLSKVISKMDNVVCYGVGPTIDVGTWREHREQFVAIGNVDYGVKYYDFLNACDVYVNSIPIGGGVAILDAIQFQKPVLQYSLFRDSLGEIIKGIETVYDIEIFNERLKNILLSEKYANEYAKEQYNQVIKNHGICNWRKNIDAMLKNVPKTHKVKVIKKTKPIIDDLAIMISCWCKYVFEQRCSRLSIIYHFIKMKFDVIIQKII